MPVFPSQGGSKGTWGTELRSFFSPYFDLATSKPIAAYVDAASYALLSDALTAAAGKTLLIGKNFTLIANTTIPSTVSIEMLKGGSFTKASTFTLTINGPFEAGLYQVFSGFSAGNVTFGAGAGKEVYPEWWGAKADGLTDCAATSAIATGAVLNGDIIYSGGGVYLHTDSIRPNSNQRLIFKNKSSIKNTAVASPNNIAIDARGVLGTSYAINTPVIGLPSITTTSASDAGNFSAGNFIFLGGPDLSGAWVPAMITKVISVNAGTGVIIIDENIRRTDFTKVFKVTTIKQNIEIIDATIDQAAQSAIAIQYGYNVLVKNATVGNAVPYGGVAITATSKARVIGYNGLYGNPIGFNSVYDGLIDGSMMIQSQLGGGISQCISIEGGCESVKVVNNTIADATNNAIAINSNSQDCTVMGNQIYNVAAGMSGIFVDGNSLGYGRNIIANNLITGATGTTTGSGIIIASASHYNTISGNVMKDLANGIIVYSGNNNETISANTIINILNPYVIQGTVTNGALLGQQNIYSMVTLSTNNSTPSLAGGTLFFTSNSSPTTITGFTDAVIGYFTIVVNDNNTTFDFTGTALKGNGGADLVCQTNDILEFFYTGYTFNAIIGKVH